MGRRWREEGTPASRRRAGLTRDANDAKGGETDETRRTARGVQRGQLVMLEVDRHTASTVVTTESAITASKRRPSRRATT